MLFSMVQKVFFKEQGPGSSALTDYTILKTNSCNGVCDGLHLYVKALSNQQPVSTSPTRFAKRKFYICIEDAIYAENF